MLERSVKPRPFVIPLHRRGDLRDVLTRQKVVEIHSESFHLVVFPIDQQLLAVRVVFDYFTPLYARRNLSSESV